MFAVLHFNQYFQDKSAPPMPSLVDVRIFATMAEVRAYCAGHLDAHNYDDEPYTLRIYNEKGEVVD